MTKSERRREQKKYEKDFSAFCKITKQYFPELIQWLQKLEEPRKFWTYEIEVMLMTVIMKNICNIHSMQKMTDVSGRNLSKMKMEMSARTTAKQKRSKGFPKDCKRRSSAIIGGRYHCDNCPLLVMKKQSLIKSDIPYQFHIQYALI